MKHLYSVVLLLLIGFVSPNAFGERFENVVDYSKCNIDIRDKNITFFVNDDLLYQIYDYDLSFQNIVDSIGDKFIKKININNIHDKSKTDVIALVDDSLNYFSYIIPSGDGMPKPICIKISDEKLIMKSGIRVGMSVTDLETILSTKITNKKLGIRNLEGTDVIGITLDSSYKVDEIVYKSLYID